MLIWRWDKRVSHITSVVRSPEFRFKGTAKLCFSLKTLLVYPLHSFTFPKICWTGSILEERYSLCRFQRWWDFKAGVFNVFKLLRKAKGKPLYYVKYWTWLAFLFVFPFPFGYAYSVECSSTHKGLNSIVNNNKKKLMMKKIIDRKKQASNQNADKTVIGYICLEGCQITGQLVQ